MKTLSDLSGFSSTDRVNIRLQENGINFLVGEITEENTNEIIKWILFENLNKAHRELTLYINSSGGDLYQAFALIAVMKTSQIPIKTIGIGYIMSSAFLIFASGSKGQRIVSKNTGAMCHQFSDNAGGKYHEIKSQVIETDYCNARMLSILKDASGLPERKIKSRLLSPTDVYLTAQELIELNIADKLLETDDQ